MPKITFEGNIFECSEGVNLRKELLKHKLYPYNGPAVFLNCHGFGTCGTCAVKIEGAASPMEKREKLRLSLPPHRVSSGLRLSCQVRVMGDLKVTKCPGFWGEKINAQPL